MDRPVTTISYREIFFYLYFAVMFGMRMWGVYEGTGLYGPLLILGFGLWGISVLMTEHTLFEYLVMAVFLAVAGLVYTNTGEKGLLLYFTLMLGMKGIEVKKLFRVGVIVGGVGMLCMAFLTSFGFAEDLVYLQSRPLVGTVFRHALGMPHPNTLSTSFTILTMMIMYIVGHEDSIRVWKASVFLSFIALYFYLYSGSRTGIAINLGFLGLNLLYTYRRRIGFAEKVILILLFPVVWGISIILPMVISDDLVVRLKEIDVTLMSRIDYGKGYLSYNPVTLFGSRVINPDTVYGIDMAQLYLFLNLGIVAFCLVTVLYILLVVHEVRENLVSEFVITTLFLIMGLSDPFLYNISFKNICFVFMGEMLYGYVESVQSRLPDVIALKVHPIKFGSKDFVLKIPKTILNIRNDCVRISRSQKTVVIVGAIIVAAMVAIVVYRSTPNPEYAMTDRSIGEHRQLKGLEGRTYTEYEIKNIKNEGNIVINYTDENELMYVYYSDENSPVEGGYYSGNAAIIEKIRRSISIFLWGSALLAGISLLAVSKWYATGNNNGQGQI